MSFGLDYSLTWSCYDPKRQELKSRRAEGLKALSMYLAEVRQLSIPGEGFREAGVRDLSLVRCRLQGMIIIRTSYFIWGLWR